MTSVRSRILLFFSFFALVSLSAVLLSGRNVRSIGRAANSIVHFHLPMVHALDEMQLSVHKQDLAVYHYIVSKDKSWLEKMEHERINFTRYFDIAENMATEDTEKNNFTSIADVYMRYDNLSRQMVLQADRDIKKTFLMVDEGEEYLRMIESLVDEIKGIREGMTSVRQDQIQETLNRYQKIGVYFLAAIVLLFLILALYLWKILVEPLSLLLDGIRNFTRGKTDIVIPKIGKDELGELQEAFNEMSRELALERKRLKSESQSDSLTGLFNMRYFRAQLVDEFSRSQRYSRPLTLLMIDVDHFKIYNDRNGHPAGDLVLKEVARILVRNVRGTDIVARYGGEEFVVLLPETPLDAGSSVAEKIRKATHDHNFPFAGSQGSERMTLSIGVASYPDVHITSDQDLIEASDKALYEAKRTGRNKVCLFSQLDSANANVPTQPKILSTKQ